MKIKPNLIIFLFMVIGGSIALPTPKDTIDEVVIVDDDLALPNTKSNNPLKINVVVDANADAADDENLKKFNYASIQSQIVATSLLKDSIDIDGNHIYSPLGISSILAILAEGARGDTYREFMTTLGYPENKNDLRESFKWILSNFHQKPIDFTETLSPTFKTWFYIYRNNTARNEFKEILKNYYSVDVKDIDKLEFNWNVPDTATSTSTSTNAPHEKEVNSFLNPDEKKQEIYDGIKIPTTVNSKDILEFEDLKKSEPFDSPSDFIEDDDDDDIDIERSEPIELLLLEKEASKFDSVVDDKQYVEVPIIKAEITKEKQRKAEEEKEKEKHKHKQQEQQNDDMILVEEIIEPIEEINNEKEINDKIETIEIKLNENNENDEDNETIKDEEKIEELRKNIDDKTETIIEFIKESNEPEKITIPIEKLDDTELLEAVESRYLKHRFTKSRSLLQKDDIASALSANSITGRETPSKTKMLLFNGLYYRGNWAYPFQELRISKLKEKFYVSNDKTMLVEMMRTHGQFRTANLESLKSQAIELPYENKRYSFIIIVPNEREGLHKLIETIQPVDLQMLTTLLVDTKAAICLPKFEVEETTRSEGTLKKLGLKKIFSKYLADLGDLSDDSSLHVEEIVQHVNLRVDEGAASKNALTATNPGGNEARSDTIKDDEQSVIVNRPFLYFVMDQTNNFIIVAGKISAPEIKEEFGLADEF